MCKDNSLKLAALCRFLGLPLSSVAKAAKVSPCYVSRVLSQRDHLQGSESFWMRVENELPRLVAERRRPVFSTSGTQSEQAMELVKLSSE